MEKQLKDLIVEFVSDDSLRKVLSEYVKVCSRRELLAMLKGLIGLNDK
uniref:Uncharacterized protein n=1 Tax=viral metagenome TaxID=1070528 RepID=A0A6H1ZFX5_9ZZZZ